MKEIYLDHTATTCPCNEAVEAFMRVAVEKYGNPSSLHMVGLQAELILNEARKTIADALKVPAECITFTSGATESNNLAVFGTAFSKGKHKPRIVTSAVEHASVAETVSELEKQGYEVVRVKPREDGLFYARDFIDALDENTCLLSLMLVNNENGTILPAQEIFTEAKKKYPQIITHCDCVQGFMKLPIRPQQWNMDLLSASGHKIRAFKGIGILYVKKGVHLKPLCYGGHQEKGLRPGTESVPLAYAMASAVKTLLPTMEQRKEKIREIRTYLERRLKEKDYIHINSTEQGISSIFNCSVSDVRSEIMLHALESEGIYVSSGSACSKGQNSGVLEQFGATRKQADEAIRISLCETNTKEEMDILVEKIDAIHERVAKKGKKK